MPSSTFAETRPEIPLPVIPSRNVVTSIYVPKGGTCVSKAFPIHRVGATVLLLLLRTLIAILQDADCTDDRVDVLHPDGHRV